MASMNEKYDQAFLGILQNEGQIAGFLDAIFGFLYRRTDYYRIMKSPDDKMGFPPEVALRLVVSAYKKYEDFAKKDEVRMEKMLQQKKKRDELKQQQAAMELESMESNDPGVPAAACIEEVISEDGTESKSKEVASEAESDTLRNKQLTTESKETINKEMTETKSSQPETQNVKSSLETSNPSQQAGTERKIENMEVEKKPEKTKTGDSDENPELTRLQKIYQDNPESYNGAIRDKYAWSQNINEVDVRILVPRHIKKGRDVKVDIGKKYLKASHKTTSGNWDVIVEGALTWDINKEESMWSLVPGEHIHVNFEKVQERWWEAVLEDEPPISVRKIDASRPITDLDDEAQAKIEEMMYNEQQKRLGLPQSHEQNVHSMLKKAWDADGSPFKGQPFDPSKINVSPNNAMNIGK